MGEGGNDDARGLGRQGDFPLLRIHLHFRFIFDFSFQELHRQGVQQSFLESAFQGARPELRVVTLARQEQLSRIVHLQDQLFLSQPLG